MGFVILAVIGWVPVVGELAEFIVYLVAVGGGGNGNCVSIATLPNGLLVQLTKSGQLAALYDEGAFC